MLEMAELLYEANDKFIKCDIPSLGAVTYYPKADKLQIDKTNTWMEYGYTFVKQCLESNDNTFGFTDTKQSASLVKIKEEKSDSELRNEFAGLAMQGILSNSYYLENIEKNLDYNIVAKNSYEIADAMVKRSKL